MKNPMKIIRDPSWLLLGLALGLVFILPAGVGKDDIWHMICAQWTMGRVITLDKFADHKDKKEYQYRGTWHSFKELMAQCCQGFAWAENLVGFRWTHERKFECWHRDLKRPQSRLPYV